MYFPDYRIGIDSLPDELRLPVLTYAKRPLVNFTLIPRNYSIMQVNFQLP